MITVITVIFNSLFIVGIKFLKSNIIQQELNKELRGTIQFFRKRTSVIALYSCSKLFCGAPMLGRGSHKSYAIKIASKVELEGFTSTTFSRLLR